MEKEEAEAAAGGGGGGWEEVSSCVVSGADPSASLFCSELCSTFSLLELTELSCSLSIAFFSRQQQKRGKEIAAAVYFYLMHTWHKADRPRLPKWRKGGGSGNEAVLHKRRTALK